MDAGILECERTKCRGFAEAFRFIVARLDIENGVEVRDHAVGDILHDPFATVRDERLRPVRAERIERHIARLELPLETDTDTRPPEFAVQVKAGAVGIDDEGLENDPRQLAVDRACGGEPANRNRGRKNRGQGDLPLPARDVEDDAAENAAGSHVEPERARERNAESGEILQVGGDEGELRQVQPGEPDGGAAHLALPVMEQLDFEMDLQFLHLQFHRQMTEDRSVVQIEGEVGVGCRPGEIGHLVAQDEGGIAETDPLELRQRVIFARRVEQVGDQGVAGGIVRADALSASGEVHAPVRPADEAEARLDQLDRCGRDGAAQQGRAAQSQRRRRHRRQGIAVRVGDTEFGQSDFECLAPAGPDEDGVLELEEIGKIVAFQGLLDIGREKAEREGTARQPPRA